jgi:hypothetical protein
VWVRRCDAKGVRHVRLFATLSVGKSNVRKRTKQANKQWPLSLFLTHLASGSFLIPPRKSRGVFFCFYNACASGDERKMHIFSTRANSEQAR